MAARSIAGKQLAPAALGVGGAELPGGNFACRGCHPGDITHQQGAAVAEGQHQGPAIRSEGEGVDACEWLNKAANPLPGKSIPQPDLVPGLMADSQQAAIG